MGSFNGVLMGVSTQPVLASRLLRWAAQVLIPVLTMSAAHALPTGMEGVAGNPQFSQVGNTLTVTSQANQSIANYQTFHVAPGETVNFNLPSAQSAILNRVVSGDPATIAGSLNSNGQVFLSSPGGVVFGSTAQVNVGGLFATTLGISNQDFLAGSRTFRRVGSAAPASVVNEGHLEAAPGGAVVLAGSAVENGGAIVAPLGQVHLAVGDQVSMGFNNGVFVDVKVDRALHERVASLNTAVSNTGSIQASGGQVHLQAALAKDVYQRAVNNDGQILAQGLATHNGVVMLTAATGTDSLVRNGGQINVSGTEGSPDGGHVTLTGDTVIQAGTLLAEGAQNGHGGAIELASIEGTLLTKTSLASARGAGDDSSAGSIRVFSDKVTDFREGARLNVNGGNHSGDAGFVELSGRDTLYLDGQATGLATHGQQGTVLIDPRDITLSTLGLGVLSRDSNTLPDEGFSDSAGLDVVYNPLTLLTGLLFPNVHLQATRDITVNAALNLSSLLPLLPTSSLTLEAGRNLTISAPITTNTGAIRLRADADTAGGLLGDGVGTLTVNAALTTNNSPITLQGADVAINAAVNAGTATVNLTPSTDSITLGLGTGSTGAFNVSGAELNRITAGNVVLGSATASGALDLGAANLTTAGANLTLQTTGAITNTIPGAGVNITLAADRNLTVLGGAGSVGSIGAGAIELATAGTGAVSVATTGGSVFLHNTGDLRLNTVTTGSGTVSLGAQGLINDQGSAPAIVTTGPVSLQAGAGIGTTSTLNLDTTGNVTVTANGLVDLTNAGAFTIAGFNSNNHTVSLTTTAGPINVSAPGVQVNTGTGTLVLNSAGGIGTLSPLDITTTGAVTAISTGGQGVSLHDTSNLLLNSVLAGAGTVSLSSDGLINDQGSSPAIVTTGNVNLLAGSGIGTTSTLNLSVGGLLGASSNNGGDMDITGDTLILDNVDSHGGNIRVTSTVGSINDSGVGLHVTSGTGQLSLNSATTLGDLSAIGSDATGRVTIAANGLVNLINAGALTLAGLNSNNHTVSLTTTAGPINVSAPGVQVNSGSGTLALNSSGGIGTTSTLGINATGNVTVAANGLVDLTDASAFTIAGLNSNNHTVSLTTTAGPINVSAPGVQVNSGSGTLALNSSGGIGTTSTLGINATGNVTVAANGLVDLTDASAFTIAGLNSNNHTVSLTTTAGPINVSAPGVEVTTGTGTLALNSAGGIGTTSTLGINATGNVTVAANGLVNLTDTSALSVATIDSAGHDVSLGSSGGALIGVTGPGANITTGAGNLFLSSAAGTGQPLVIDTDGIVTAASTGDLAVRALNGLQVGAVTSHGGAIALTASNGNLNNTAGTTAALDSGGGNLTLSSSGSIGNLRALRIQPGSAPGGLVTATASNGSVNILSSSGLRLGTITAGNGGVTLGAAGGDILNGSGAPVNIVATGNSVLTASGVIGTPSSPVGTVISNGGLTLNAAGGGGGTSINANGTVAPGNTIVIGTASPGSVILNGTPLASIPGSGPGTGGGLGLPAQPAGTAGNDLVSGGNQIVLDSSGAIVLQTDPQASSGRVGSDGMMLASFTNVQNVGYSLSLDEEDEDYEADEIEDRTGLIAETFKSWNSLPSQPGSVEPLKTLRLRLTTSTTGNTLAR